MTPSVSDESAGSSGDAAEATDDSEKEPANATAAMSARSGLRCFMGFSILFNVNRITVEVT